MGSEPVQSFREIANNLGKSVARKDLRIAELEAERDEMSEKLATSERELALERSATNHGTYAICAKHPKEFSIGKPRGAQCRECMAEKLAKLSAFVESVSKAANCPTMDGRAFCDWVEHAADHYNRADDKILWHEEARELAEKLAKAREVLALCDRALDLRRQLEARPFGAHATLDPWTVVQTESVARKALAQFAPTTEVEPDSGQEVKR